jgi:glycosidase
VFVKAASLKAGKMREKSMKRVLKWLSQDRTFRATKQSLPALALRRLLVAAMLLIAATGRAEELTLLNDIRVRTSNDSLFFFNNRLSCRFDLHTGDWSVLAYPQIGNIIARPSPSVDILLNNQLYFHDNLKFSGYEYRVFVPEQRVELTLFYQAKDDSSLTLSSQYSLFTDSPRLQRSASIHNHSETTFKLSGFRFDLPGAAIGNPADCRLDAPGPWFPATFIGPQKPYNELVNQQITFHSAPEAGFGLMVLSNPKKNLAIATWMETDGEVDYQPSVRGDGRLLTLSFTDNRQYRLTPNMTVVSDPLMIEWTGGSMADALKPYRRMVCEHFPLGPSPEWVNGAVILEAYPRYFKDGFRGITARLPFYREVGFNCLYLMPHWLGGYSPIDLFQVNSDYGSEKDLQELVKTAHSLGMKVLFDMVIHGMNEKSPLMMERPELFCKDKDGNIVRHPTWKSMTFDWASPDYQAFMMSLVQHDLDVYDIDGYRVDAASYKGPNWDPMLPYPAFRSGAAAPELMANMLETLRRTKPDAVLLSEVFGPLFHHICNFVHDNQTEAAQMMIEKIDAGEATAETYKTHLADVFDMLPPGANRVFYTRNHDTSWFYHFKGYTPRFLAFEAVHALCAIPEIFSGDPDHGPNPEDDPATYNYYQQLFALRGKYKTLVEGRPLFREVVSSNPLVFSAIKEWGDQRMLILVSMSRQKETVTLQFDPSIGRIASVVRLIGLNKNEAIMKDSMLTLEPFAVFVGELN